MHVCDKLKGKNMHVYDKLKSENLHGFDKLERRKLHVCDKLTFSKGKDTVFPNEIINEKGGVVGGFRPLKC